MEFATQTLLFPTKRDEELNHIFSSAEAEREGGLQFANICNILKSQGLVAANCINIVQPIAATVPTA